MLKDKLKFLIIALVGGSLVGGVALDLLGLSAPVASGAGAGVSAALMWYSRRFSNRT